MNRLKTSSPVVAGLLAFALLLQALALAPRNAHQRYDRRLTPKEERWVKQTLRALTLDEKIGQMFLADGNAIFMNRESEAYKQLVHHVVDNKVGGVLWFRSDVWATAVMTNRLQQMAKLPLFVAADLEMGLGMRLDDTPWWPPNMAVAATGDENYARLQGQATAVEARAIGINWLFAPVVDVNNNPQNPVINVRSYGEDPPTVAAFAGAFVEGAQQAGILACAKHFPGHGDTATDSHIGLPVVDADRRRLDQVELVPFREVIARGIGSVMSAHISLPQIEPEPAAPVRELSAAERMKAEFQSVTESDAARVTRPATLSPKIVGGILRGDLKFGGLIVTDAMNMAGVAARYDAATSSVLAVKAGVDVIEKCPDIDAGIRGVKEAVARGEISEARINESVERVLRAKAALGLIARRTVQLDGVDLAVSHPSFTKLAQDIADDSITLVRDDARLLPLKGASGQPRLLNVTFTDDDAAFNTQPFAGELAARGLLAGSVTLDQRAGEDEVKRLLDRLDEDKAAGRFDAVIFSVVVRARSGKGSVALPPVGARLAEELTRRELPLVVISFGNPYLLAAMPRAKTYVAAYSPFPFSQRAAARALAGEIGVTGKLPVSLPGLYPRGHGVEIKASRDAAR
jgi:beta-N-acetylhexosaminidase